MYVYCVLYTSTPLTIYDVHTSYVLVGIVSTSLVLVASRYVVILTTGFTNNDSKDTDAIVVALPFGNDTVVYLTARTLKSRTWPR